MHDGWKGVTTLYKLLLFYMLLSLQRKRKCNLFCLPFCGRLSVLSHPDHPVCGSVSSLFTFAHDFLSQPGGQGKLRCTSRCLPPRTGLPVAALAGSQPAGREPRRMQSLRSGNNYHLSKPSVQNSRYVALDPDFWICVLQILQKWLESFW